MPSELETRTRARRVAQRLRLDLNRWVSWQWIARQLGQILPQFQTTVPNFRYLCNKYSVESSITERMEDVGRSDTGKLRPSY